MKIRAATQRVQRRPPTARQRHDTAGPAEAMVVLQNPRETLRFSKSRCVYLQLQITSTNRADRFVIFPRTRCTMCVRATYAVCLSRNWSETNSPRGFRQGTLLPVGVVGDAANCPPLESIVGTECAVLAPGVGNTARLGPTTISSVVGDTYVYVE
ncbi:hypothetical protein J6590_071286 [Homalodisca vitripennis]|nr:hypothetical protein J6590_071286 [Homalodisca vitripennis]